MSPTENVQVMRAVFSAIERRDVQGLLELCQPDVEFVWPPTLPYGGTSRGFKSAPPTWGHTWIPLQPTEAEQRLDPE